MRGSSVSGRLARALAGRLVLGTEAASSSSGRVVAAAAAAAANAARGPAGRARRGLASAVNLPHGLVGRPGVRPAGRVAPVPHRGLASEAAAAPDAAPLASAADPTTAQAPPSTPHSTDRPHPLDFTTLAALAAALRTVALPAKVDEVVQVDGHTVCLRVRAAPAEAAPGAPGAGAAAGGPPASAADPPLETLWIWLCWHALGARTTVGPPPPRGGPAEAYAFGRALQAALGGGVLVQARCPVPYERCVELLFAPSVSAPPETALILQARSHDSLLALVDVGLRAGPPLNPKGKPSAEGRPAPRSKKTVRLPPKPNALMYGRILAVAHARPGKGYEARRRELGIKGKGPRPLAPGDTFFALRPSARQMLPTPSETFDLWRANVCAADADAAEAEAERVRKEEEAEEEAHARAEGAADEADAAPPAPPPPPQQKRKPDPGVAACLARTYAGVGRAAADEMCAAAGVDPSAPPGTLGEGAWARLHAAWTRWLVSLSAAHFAVGPGLPGRPFSVLGERGSLLAGGPLADRDPLALAAAAGADGVNGRDPRAVLPAMASPAAAFELMATVDAYFRGLKDAIAPTTLESHVQGGTARALKRARDKVSSLAAQASRAESAEAKAHTADLILAHVHAVPAGACEMTATDWETGEELVIPLGDGRTPPHDVAAALYKEARRLRRGAEAVAPLLGEARAAVAELEDAAAQLASLPPLGEDGEAADVAAGEARTAVLQEVRAALEAKGWLPPWREAGLEARGAALARKAAKRTDGRALGGSPSASAPRFRRFTSPSGLDVLVGRNNRDNDTLSLRVANPGDTWLHARGVPGAHVLLRAPPGADAGGSAPPEPDLRFAAALAAFFSKAREGGQVDVSHTPARHVKKPRGAPPGLVTLMQEAVVRVRPDDAAEAVAAAGESDDGEE